MRCCLNTNCFASIICIIIIHSLFFTNPDKKFELTNKITFLFESKYHLGLLHRNNITLENMTIVYVQNSS